MNTSGLTPVEFFVVVALDPTENKIGSIIVPDAVVEKDKLATQEGTLIAVSPHAFTYAEGWPEDTKPQLGQRVLFRRFAGHVHERGGKTYRLIADKDIIAIVEPPAAAAREAA